MTIKVTNDDIGREVICRKSTPYEYGVIVEIHNGCIIVHTDGGNVIVADPSVLEYRYVSRDMCDGCIYCNSNDNDNWCSKKSQPITAIYAGRGPYRLVCFRRTLITIGDLQ